jgi:hypothetical protein
MRYVIGILIRKGVAENAEVLFGGVEGEEKRSRISVGRHFYGMNQGSWSQASFG